MRWAARSALMTLSMSAVALAAAVPAAADNWPQWRGPTGDGICRENNVPVAWSEFFGLLWTHPLPGWGDSTPIVWGDAVFVTTQENNERLLLLRIDAATGNTAWMREVGSQRTPHSELFRKEGDARRRQNFHRDHNFATPSPSTDGQRVVVHFGNGLLAAYDFSGNELWKRNLEQDYGEYTIWWGHANSPLLYKDLVISACMQDSCADLPGKPSESYVVAHDARTGKEIWRTLRLTGAKAEQCDSYTTPIVYRHDARDEIVVMGGQMIDAYDPAGGKRLWYLPGMMDTRCVTGPVAAQGVIYATQGMRRPLWAIKPSREGQLSRDDIVWRLDQGTPDSSTPVVWKDLLFMVDNNGVARCLNALDGRLLWKERLKGSYRASPVAAEGRIYFLNIEGLTTIISASTRFDRLTENQLPDTTFASPAISGGRIYIRGKKALYCVRK